MSLDVYKRQAVSNVLAAVLSGVKGLHTTINGLGERAGNAPLASVQAILKLSLIHISQRVNGSNPLFSAPSET